MLMFIGMFNLLRYCMYKIGKIADMEARYMARTFSFENTPPDHDHFLIFPANILY